MESDDDFFFAETEQEAASELEQLCARGGFTAADLASTVKVLNSLQRHRDIYDDRACKVMSYDHLASVFSGFLLREATRLNRTTDPRPSNRMSGWPFEVF